MIFSFSINRGTGKIILTIYGTSYRYSRTPLPRISRDQQLLSVIGGILLLPIYEIKEKLFMGLKNYFHYWRNYNTSGSVIAGCDCTFL